MTVKRYGSAAFDSSLIEMACGDYVTYSDYQKLVAENAELNSRTVKVPTKVYVKDMKSNVVRWAQVIDALSDAGIAFVRDDGELIAGTRETPATDAAIAEIKAQGVELLRDSIPDIETSIEDTRDLNHYCNDFAANLRAGRKE